jgi:hypothetical protein
MIDLQNETAVSLSGAAKILPAGRRGRPVSLSCILRWVVDGVKTPNGVVRLEAVRLGSRWITSHEALSRFADRLTPKFDAAESPPRPRTAAQRRRASEQAAAELDRLGI